jgi:hypothetical protein
MTDKLARPRMADEVLRGDEPEIGRWYWVRDDADDEPCLACVVTMGSNFIGLEGVGCATRIHNDDFWSRCTYEPNAEQVIQGKIRGYQENTKLLVRKVQEITSRLAITPGLALSDGQPEKTETALVAMRGEMRPASEYKAALIKAKKEDLPQLFQEIESNNTAMGRWMKATLIPLRAQAEGLKSTIGAIEERIFSVELYAGLVETVTQFADGAPAPTHEKIHLFQRRHYMDEECLVNYETGGMEFANLGEFDQWLARPVNRDRILPYPRTIAAFQVRRNRKGRDTLSLSDFISVMELDKADKATFLYIRNGEQLFRLGTEIDFGERLFLDLDQQLVDRGTIWVKMSCGKVKRMISDHEYQAMLEEERRIDAEWEKAPETERWRHSHFHETSEYQPFDRSNVYYDEIVKHLADEAARHNRLVLVLQGLLDRSPVMHPHPAWSLWTPEGFTAGLTLVYDDSRALVAGERPDFEAYRARLNASLKAGSITVGQDDAWARAEADKEYERESARGHGSYRPTHHRPYGNPGPGMLARVVRYAPRAKTCTYEWERQRRTYDEDYYKGRRTVPVSFTTETSNILNVDAYRPGDFKMFFNDPRTRADYLEWAPLLLEAEEYHAGNRKVQEPPVPTVRKKSEEGSWEYEKRKCRRALRGKAVRLTRAVTTRGGTKYEVGSLWRVTGSHGDLCTITGITPDGKTEMNDAGCVARLVCNVDSYSFDVDETIPKAPKAPKHDDES